MWKWLWSNQLISSIKKNKARTGRIWQLRPLLHAFNWKWKTFIVSKLSISLITVLTATENTTLEKMQFFWKTAAVHEHMVKLSTCYTCRHVDGQESHFSPKCHDFQVILSWNWCFYSWRSLQLTRWSSESIIFIVSAVSRHTQNLSEAKTEIIHLRRHVIGASIIHAQSSNYEQDRKWAITPFLKRRLGYWM